MNPYPKSVFILNTLDKCSNFLILQATAEFFVWLVMHGGKNCKPISPRWSPLLLLCRLLQAAHAEVESSLSLSRFLTEQEEWCRETTATQSPCSPRWYLHLITFKLQNRLRIGHFIPWSTVLIYYLVLSIFFFLAVPPVPVQIKQIYCYLLATVLAQIKLDSLTPKWE